MRWFIPILFIATSASASSVINPGGSGTTSNSFTGQVNFSSAVPVNLNTTGILNLYETNVGPGPYYAIINYVVGAVGQSGYQFGIKAGNAPAGFWWGIAGSTAMMLDQALTANQFVKTDSNLNLVSYDLFNSTQNWTAPQTFIDSMTVVNSLSVTTNGSQNITPGLLDVYSQTATSGSPLFSVGSANQNNQFVVADQQPLGLTRYGVDAGALQIGLSGVTHSISDNDSAQQFINYWNNGEMDLQTASIANGGGNIVLKPNIVTMLTAGGTGVTVSTNTFFTGGGAPANSQALCLLSGQLGHCTSVVGVAGGCTCVAP